tara:strand:- start:124 stop:732 length:609 start_codon:yes stop_codon:yes gene_type:complete
MAISLANNNSLANITALPASITGGAMTLLATQTASSSASLSFTSGIDSTYDKYVFKFINIHPSGTEKEFGFQVNRVGQDGFNEPITSTNFKARHTESDSAASLGYNTAGDQAQGTAFQQLSEDSGNASDNCICGELTIYNPSNTTFVKHFISTIVEIGGGTAQLKNNFIAGYINVTGAVDEVQFKMSEGNIDSGVIKLYGVS